MINIGHGYFAFYAHMQPHSLRVHVGEHVKQGQVIGLLGNTGNSDAPHLHFHVMAEQGPLSSDGLPFELRSFVSEGTITSPLDDLFNGKPAIIGPASRGYHRHELPLENEVISFRQYRQGVSDLPFRTSGGEYLPPPCGAGSWAGRGGVGVGGDAEEAEDLAL